ncbi:MAG: FAD-dependent oxidoreductase, partial [Pseudomonadota bacterium]
VGLPPKLLFSKLLADAEIETQLKSRFTNIRSGSGTFRMNIALRELPDFLARPGKQQADHHGAGIIIGPTMDYLDNAFLDAKREGWSREPVIEMLIPSTIDKTLAPPGQHVASLFVQHVAPRLPGPRSWEDISEKEAFADHVIATLGTYAPNLPDAVIARQVLSPWDLEQRFGLIDGDIFHGQLGLDQLFSNRPVLGYGNYRMPVKGLYLCGSGAHPGGGVSGVPGHNAAREILADQRLGWLNQTMQRQR